MIRKTILALALTASLLAALGTGPAQALVRPAQVGTPTENWLTYSNWYRAMCGLPLLTEDPALSSGCTLHALYMVKNNTLARVENPANQWYTAEGNEAGQNSNVFVSALQYDPFTTAIDQWIEGPFEAVGLLDPQLRTVGYGEHRELMPGQYTQYAATMDVIRGRTGGADSPTTVYWPPVDGVTPIAVYESGSDWPDPLTHCPGYPEIAGAAVILMIGLGEQVPAVTATSFTHNGQPLAHCVFDETTYTSTDPTEQEWGRAVLSFRDAVILIPQQPLTPGESYSVSITVNGAVHAWSFTVSPEATIPER